jgi:hypothetical protein
MNRHEMIVLEAAKLARRREGLSLRRSLTQHIPGQRQITTREWSRARASVIERGLLTPDDTLTQAGRKALEAM